MYNDSIMYTVQCALYIVKYTMHIIHCACTAVISDVLGTVYNVYCIILPLLHTSVTSNSVKSVCVQMLTIIPIGSIAIMIDYTLYTIQYALYTIHYTLHYYWKLNMVSACEQSSESQ